MGRFVWMGVVSTGAAIFIGLFGMAANSDPERGVAVADSARSVALLSTPSVEEVETSGTALAAAAFGMSALQPDTYNGELVVHIIEASPLAEAVKRGLVTNLAAAEAGRADLDKVLTEVRVALALE